MAEPPVRFAGVLRRLRAGAGLTQEELATAAGLSSRATMNCAAGYRAGYGNGGRGAGQRALKPEFPAQAGELLDGRHRKGTARDRQCAVK